MTNIFIVNGHGGSGKTTFENMVVNFAKKDKKKAIICSTIDWVKMFARSAGWNGTKEPKDRKFLSDLKDALSSWNDIPYRETKMIINRCYQDETEIVFIDCREPKEIERFVNELQATTILVKRGVPVALGNHADDEVDNYSYDIVIDNGGTIEDLEKTAHEFYLNIFDTRGDMCE